MATNEQRREAAKRKLERQLEHREQRAKRNRMIAVVSTVAVVLVGAGVAGFFVWQDRQEEAEAREARVNATKPDKIPTERIKLPQRSKPLANPTSCKYKKSPEPAAKKVGKPKNGKVDAKGEVKVKMPSSAGDIGLTLDRALAPCTVNSFEHLVKEGYFDNTPCHRIGTKGLLMLQCGDPSGTGEGGPGYTVPDEKFKELKYGRGVLAMARSQAPNSGGSQFFMVYGEAELPPEYTVFGSIDDDGLKTIDKVAMGGHDASMDGPQGPGGGKPNTPVKFTKATVEK